MTYLAKHANLTYGPQSNIEKYTCVQIYKHKIGLGDLKNMIKLKIVCAFVTVKCLKSIVNFIIKIDQIA